MWAVLLLALSGAGLVGFVYHDVAVQRRLDDEFLREVEELRQQYNGE